MAEIRGPRGVVVNGVFFLVKDPNAAAGSLFANYQRLGSHADVNMPSEVGSVNETPTTDGNLAAAAFKGVGTITAAIAGRNASHVHQFLEQRSLDGAQVEIAVVRLAVARIGGEGVPAAGDLVTVVRADGSPISVVNIVKASLRNLVKNAVRQGDLIFIGDAPPSEVAAFGAAKAVGNDSQWQVVTAVEAEGKKVLIAPGLSAAIAAGANRKLYIRSPGLKWTNLVGTINGFDGGSFSQGGQVGSNLTFTPDSAVPAATPEFRIPDSEGLDAAQTMRQADDGSYTP